ncbi:hypothetical protein ACLRDC_19225 [Gluconacetobacter sacchari]|uniref:Uncharacterized protein n=1 Tax=Gluconacetobacter sacchari TaxID=92759 RepID=A0A7W4ID90_9PROT|nr:hypothetical protein [Gluconacetobacter sacchari]MBB2160746.1 hypothetical protein [Gluconacetobacter sacchari]
MWRMPTREDGLFETKLGPPPTAAIGRGRHAGSVLALSRRWLALPEQTEFATTY